MYKGCTTRKVKGGGGIDQMQKKKLCKANGFGKKTPAEDNAKKTFMHSKKKKFLPTK